MRSVSMSRIDFLWRAGVGHLQRRMEDLERRHLRLRGTVAALQRDIEALIVAHEAAVQLASAKLLRYQLSVTS
jgi:hypothetical protein